MEKNTNKDISRKLDDVYCKIRLVQDALVNRKENAEDCNPVFAGLIGVLSEAGNEINELQTINDETFIDSLGKKRTESIFEDDRFFEYVSQIKIDGSNPADNLEAWLKEHKPDYFEES